MSPHRMTRRRRIAVAAMAAAGLLALSATEASAAPASAPLSVTDDPLGAAVDPLGTAAGVLYTFGEPVGQVVGTAALLLWSTISQASEDASATATAAPATP
ncbi:hypothetical protein NX801_21780 [Streptomyces sp. LP05-1]|uniref:Secreted protein n=1 Tax=Streptomyces pyxinae TaxID=2970734 RepID=A0ABT2CLD7_9ACTN|nr:hypothetical protein [Streptomyces sp. LP05-1]MCS0638234.1 hypothetical protein [Streptomyces sp. LP05-1]